MIQEILTVVRCVAAILGLVKMLRRKAKPILAAFLQWRSKIARKASKQDAPRLSFGERMARRGIQISQEVPDWTKRLERGERSWVVCAS
jgi:hypothetical protein